MSVFEIGSEEKFERSKEYAPDECYRYENNQILMLHIKMLK